MNQSKKAWEAPVLRSEKVQETLSRAACQVKILGHVEVGTAGQRVVAHAQAVFS